MADNKIIALDDYRARVTVETDAGEQHEYMLDHLIRVSEGQASLDTLHPDALRSIIAQWIYFIDIIDEFAGDDADG